MLVSYSKNFIYFKAIRVSGTSIQVALANNCLGNKDIVTPVAHARRETPGYSPKNYKNIYDSHSIPAQIKKTIEPIFWKKATKITVVRNPWATFVSRYKAWCYYKEFREEYPTLNQYVKKNGIYTNEEFFFYPNGNKTSDVYLRQENITEDYKLFCSKYNLEEVELPRLKIAQDTRHYSCFINNKLALQIRRKCSRELAEFGYSFKRKEEYDSNPWR